MEEVLLSGHGSYSMVSWERSLSCTDVVEGMMD